MGVQILSVSTGYPQEYVEQMWIKRDDQNPAERLQASDGGIK